MNHPELRPEPEWLEELDHTADVGIVVSAESVAQLFERTAWAAFGIIVDTETVRPEETVEICVEGSDLEDLMVRWLSELNFLHVTGGRVFSEFQVQQIDERLLRARVRGEAIDPERHQIFTEIKAVTYHGLSIAETDQGYQATVIFDL